MQKAQSIATEGWYVSCYFRFLGDPVEAPCERAVRIVRGLLLWAFKLSNSLCWQVRSQISETILGLHTNFIG
jgi:hypothetical protein